MTECISYLAVGRRVWSMQGDEQLGVPPGTGGIILKKNRDPAYMTFDFYSYEVRWDTGQIGKHYADRLFCIGNFQTLQDFKKAVMTDGERITVEVGPRGGFRSFEMFLKNNGSPLRISTGVNKEYYLLRDWLKEAGLSIEVKSA